MFTVKQLLNELQKERYDEKHLPVVIVAGESDQEMGIANIRLEGGKVHIIAEKPQTGNE